MVIRPLAWPTKRQAVHYTTRVNLDFHTFVWKAMAFGVPDKKGLGTRAEKYVHKASSKHRSISAIKQYA